MVRLSRKKLAPPNFSRQAVDRKAVLSANRGDKLDRLQEVNARFIYPEYTFNEGQWLGTSKVI